MRGFLERAKLPEEIIAFAACLVEELSEAFSESWRATVLPLSMPNSNSLSWGIYSTLRSEIIILAALDIAHGYLSDGDRETKRWTQYEGNDMYTVQELEQTKWCILRDIDFGLARISEEMLQAMLRDMQHAATGYQEKSISTAVSKTKETVRLQKDERTAHLKLNLDAYNQGAAVWLNGVQTPEPSP